MITPDMVGPELTALTPVLRTVLRKYIRTEIRKTKNSVGFHEYREGSAERVNARFPSASNAEAIAVQRRLVKKKRAHLALLRRAALELKQHAARDAAILTSASPNPDSQQENPK